MNTPISTIALRNERDVVQARQRAREIAAMVGFDNQEQIRLATATSEMARNAFRYARGGKVAFTVEAGRPQTLEIVISDHGPGIENLDDIFEGRYRSSTGLGLGIMGTKRLMDKFDISSSHAGTVVKMRKDFPVSVPILTPARMQDLSEKIAANAPESPYDEIDRQNRELLKTLQELRARQEELALLNRELEDTNRGVVALYAELDERADYLRRASELKTSFLSNISHEFRTPLNSIMSLARILLDRLDGDLTREQETQIGFILESAKTLSEMVNDLLDLAKVEAGKVRMRVQSFEVSELFSALKGMLKPLLADNTSVELTFTEAESLPTLRTDEGKVSQILRNFISNAIKYTPQGEIRIRAEKKDKDLILFEVADTGIGIAQENLETVFEEFTQVDNPLQYRYRGTGLGLPLCRKLAILLGGKVWVKSELGKGSSFFAEFPVIYKGEAEIPRNTKEEMPAPEFSRDAVLLIDSDPDTFSLLEPVFRTSEFQLIHVESLERAETWLQRHLPTAIVCDMTSSAAWDFLRFFQQPMEAMEQIPIVALAAPENSSRALDMGASLAISRPLEAESLLHDVRRVTRQEQPKKLLLVDDNDLSLYILRELLDRPWLNLVEAHNGQEALDMVERERPDAVILDLVMPGMGGLEVLQKLRDQERTRRLPVIIYTSKILSGEEKNLLNVLAARLVSKSDVTTTLSPELLLSSLAKLDISGPGRT
ncbi:MAG TPA: ATP-binding protein [Candidatus Angelobacter sp.]|jgi:signal transduction histidine kinase/CheY-like chemotaxis protein